jgi:hypothetical protein
VRYGRIILEALRSLFFFEIFFTLPDSTPLNMARPGVHDANWRPVIAEKALFRERYPVGEVVVRRAE